VHLLPVVTQDSVLILELSSMTSCRKLLYVLARHGVVIEMIPANASVQVQLLASDLRLKIDEAAKKEPEIAPDRNGLGPLSVRVKRPYLPLKLEGEATTADQQHDNVRWKIFKFIKSTKVLPLQ
jgi:hypothetical protein